MSTSTRTLRRRCQQLLGELCSITIAILTAKFIFSVLQHALVDQHTQRIKINKSLKIALADWHVLQYTLLRPASLYHLVPTAPTMLAGCDASGEGMGGFFLDLGDSQPTPIAWRYQFPTHIQTQLISPSNPKGLINNSHLELAAIIASTSLMLRHADTCPQTLLCMSDNTPAVSWIQRGSTSSTGPSAKLLRILYLLGRQNPFTVSALYNPGKSNTVAHFLSRSFAYSDNSVLSRLWATTQRSWSLAQLTNEEASKLISAVSKTTSPGACQLPEQDPSKQHGSSGSPFAAQSNWTHTLTVSRTTSPRYNFLPDNTGQDAWLPPIARSALERWKQPFVPWDRRSPVWGKGILDSTKRGTSTSISPASCRHIPRRTHHRTGKNPSHYPSPSTQRNFVTASARQSTRRSQTCCSSPFISSSAQGNMPSLPVQMPRLSGSATHTSSSATANCIGIQHQTKSGKPSQQSAWNLTGRKRSPGRDHWPITFR